MAAISRAQLLRELLPGLNAIFGTSYNEYPMEFSEIYTEYSSDRSFEQDQKVTGFQSAPVKQEGAATLFDTAQEGYTSTYIMETISMGFALTQEAFEDNLYDSLSTRYSRELGRAMRNTKEIKAVVPLNTGFTALASGGYGVGDGVPLFSTSHPQVAGPVVSNRPSVAVDLNETSLENATIQISGWTDDRGKLIQARVRKMIVPKESIYIATRILETQLQTGTANNDINPIKSMGTLPGGQANLARITSTTAWWVQTDAPEGMKMVKRRGLEKSMEGDFETDNMRYKATERYAVGFTDPRAIYGTAGL